MAAVEVAIELDEPFEAFNNPASNLDCASEYSNRSGSEGDALSDAVEDEFLRRYEHLNSCLSEPYLPLSQSGELIYGETSTFSEYNIVIWKFVLGPQYKQMVASVFLCVAPVIVQTAAFAGNLTVSLHVLTWTLSLQQSAHSSGLQSAIHALFRSGWGPSTHRQRAYGSS